MASYLLKGEAPSELTICAVYHSEKNKHLLLLNKETIEAQNPKTKVTWLIADNTENGSPNDFGSDNVKILHGVRISDLPSSIPRHMRGSFHHATSLNMLFSEVKTRFVLTLDSDFYMVYPNAIDAALASMRTNGLSFFGSTWHPKYYAKYRYFPSVHCLFLDLEKVGRENIDFLPQPETYKEKEDKKQKRKLSLPWVFERIRLAATFQDRKKFIGCSRDTGYRIYEKFHNRSDLRWECLTPVLKPRLHFGALANIMYFPNRLLEIFLPDELCFIPKRKGYWSRKGFRDYGYEDAGARGWEEFLWKGVPFGVHLRGTRSGIGYQKRDFNQDFLDVKDMVYRMLPRA